MRADPVLTWAWLAVLLSLATFATWLVLTWPATFGPLAVAFGCIAIVSVFLTGLLLRP